MTIYGDISGLVYKYLACHNLTNASQSHGHYQHSRVSRQHALRGTGMMMITSLNDEPGVRSTVMSERKLRKRLRAVDAWVQLNVQQPLHARVPEG